MEKGIVRIVVREGVEGRDDDGKRSVLSPYVKDGLAVTCVDGWGVTHITSGLRVCRAKSAAEAHARMNALLPLADWTQPAEELSQTDLIAAACKVTVEKKGKVSPLDKVLAVWKGATVEGPMMHGDKMAYRVTLGAAEAWIWGGVEQPEQRSAGQE